MLKIYSNRIIIIKIDTPASINTDNKIQANTFIKDLSEDDIDSDNVLGNFTFIGKRILKRLLRQVATAE